MEAKREKKQVFFLIYKFQAVIKQKLALRCLIHVSLKEKIMTFIIFNPPSLSSRNWFPGLELPETHSRFAWWFFWEFFPGPPPSSLGNLWLLQDNRKGGTKVKGRKTLIWQWCGWGGCLKLAVLSWASMASSRLPCWIRTTESFDQGSRSLRLIAYGAPQLDTWQYSLHLFLLSSPGSVQEFRGHETTPPFGTRCFWLRSNAVIPQTQWFLCCHRLLRPCYFPFKCELRF